GIGLALVLPAGHRRTDLLDLLGRDLAEVHGEAGLDVRGQLAAAALHVDVGRVARLERGVEPGEHVLVRHRGDLDGHALVRRLEVRGDLLVVALSGLVVGVVPPGEGDVAVPAAGAGAAFAALTTAATGGQEEGRAGECRGGEGSLAACHRTHPSSSLT